MSISSFDGTSEYTFLFHSTQRYRRYGSCNDLNSQDNHYNINKLKRISIVEHKISPNETLQSICLKYDSNISEVKRINKLWNNESFYTRKCIKIPVFINNVSKNNIEVIKDNENEYDCISNNNYNNVPIINSNEKSLCKNSSNESIKELFNRIDKNTKKSIKAVMKMEKNIEVIGGIKKK
uniref:LysM domain-containing protein n=1 Tax=Parastrongyloides trichosuri TaxID=131310 RepID=A0A0N4ZR70_PARTI